jgi:hypothetical protein
MFAIMPRLFFVLCAVIVALPGAAKAVDMQIPPGDYTRQLGNGSLDDPSGAPHTRREAAGQVIVAIFSIPNMSQGSYQEKWSNLLADQSDTKLPKSVFLVLFEDMAHAGLFEGIARSDLKKQFTKGSRPLVVLDETGAIFKKYGVPRDKTEILIYDKKGVLRDVEADLSESDSEKTVTRIHAITRALQSK